MVCKNCGNSIAENTAFCSKCGTPVNYDGEATVEPSKNRVGKKSIVIASVVAVIAIIAVVVISIFVSNYASTKYMRNALATNEAFIINDVYDQAYGDSELLEKYDKLIAEKIDEMIVALDSYDFDDAAAVNGNEAVFDYIKAHWGTICEDPDDSYSSSISSSISPSNSARWKELILLLDSKNYYCTGVFYYANEDYQRAIKSFSYVSETDSNFADAETYIADSVTAYIDMSSKKAQDLIDNGDISGGIWHLTSAKEYLDNCGINSDEIKTKINETLSTYAAEYASKAEEAFKSQDVNSAIGNIEIALELQPDNADYKTKFDTYKLYQPFALYLEKNYTLLRRDDGFSGGLSLGSNLTIIANNQQEMENLIRWNSYKESTLDSINLKYDLNGKYDNVTGTLFLSEEDKNTKYKGFFEAYGDGKLIYTSPVITGGVLPQNVEFNVSGIHQLTLSFYGEGYNGFYSKNSPDFAVSNLVAQKAFPE